MRSKEQYLAGIRRRSYYENCSSWRSELDREFATLVDDTKAYDEQLAKAACDASGATSADGRSVLELSSGWLLPLAGIAGSAAALVADVASPWIGIGTMAAGLLCKVPMVVAQYRLGGPRRPRLPGIEARIASRRIDVEASATHIARLPRYWP
jgi:hypothetical protein